MKKNMGFADRIIRLLPAAFIFIMWYQQIISGPLAIVLLVIAVVFVITSFIGFCPLYKLFGFSTCRTKKEA